MEFTEQQIQELARCSNDPIYFIETFCIINHIIRGHIPFIINENQRTIIRNIHSHKKCIFDKDRQIGMSSILMAYVLWKGIFNTNERILVTNYNLTGCAHLRHILSTFIEGIPNWVLPTITTNNKNEIGFDNGSKILLSSMSPHVGRGLSLSMLVCDEFAYGKHSKDFFNNLHLENSSVIISSTPSPGPNNYFNELLQQSINGDNTLKAFKVTVDGKN